MECKRYGDMAVVRIDRGEEVVEQLEVACRQLGIRYGSVTGLRAGDKAEIGLYEVETQVYHKHVYEGEFEIANLVGSISQMDGDYYAHLHITLADASQLIQGGHLNACRISGTCEIFITCFEADFGRKKDPVTGLNILDFN